MNKSVETWEDEFMKFELDFCLNKFTCARYTHNYICGACDGISFDMARPINCIRNNNKATKWNYEVRERRKIKGNKGL